MTISVVQDATEARQEVLQAYEAQIIAPKLDLLAMLDAQEELASTLVVRSELNGRRVDSSAAVQTLTLVQKAVTRVRKELAEDVDMAVFLKAAAELEMMGGAYEEALLLLEDAKRMLATAAAQDDCADELKVCEKMASICRTHCATTSTGDDTPEALPKPDASIRQLTADDAPSVTTSTGDDSSEVRPTPNASIRQLTADDVPALMALFGKVRGESLELESASLQILDIADNGFCWIAEAADGSIVGGAIASTDGTFGYVRELLVDPSYSADNAASLEASLKCRTVEELRRKGVSQIQGFSAEKPTASGGCLVYKLACPE